MAKFRRRYSIKLLPHRTVTVHAVECPEAQYADPEPEQTEGRHVSDDLVLDIEADDRLEAQRDIEREALALGANWKVGRCVLCDPVSRGRERRNRY
jgi:hypothetical protein